MPERDHYSDKKFKDEDKFQAQCFKDTKIGMEKLLSSTFNITDEVKALATTLSVRFFMADCGIFRVGIQVADDQVLEVTLGKSGIICCGCGSLDNYGLDICGHVLFALRFAATRWRNVRETIENYVQNLLEVKE